MNISLVLLVLSLCGFQYTESRYNHGRRYDHKQETSNYPIPVDNDRGDEYRELNTPLPLLEEKANTTNEQVAIDSLDGQTGFNGHIVEAAEITVTTEQPLVPDLQKEFEDSLKESRNNAQKYGNSLKPLTVRGYGFQFSSIVPHDIRYTIEKDVLLPEQVNAEQFDGSTVGYDQIFEQLPPIQEIPYSNPPASDLIPPVQDIHIQSTPIIPLAAVQEVSNQDSQDNHGLSIGTGLRTLAQGSADQAENAVISQHIAAQQAAFVAKNALAQSAIHSAATAIAALAGKEVLLNSLEKQTEEIREQLDNELKQLQVTKKTTATARHAAQQAAYHVSILAAALNNAHQTAEHAETNEKSAAAELASQTKMVGDAKNRLDSIIGKLEAANVDFEVTKEAAAKATEAAEEADRNANNGDEKTSVLLVEHASDIGHEQESGPAYTLH